VSINEEAAAQDWLVSYLQGDSTLMNLVNSIWLRSVPRDEPTPVVKIDRLDASDVMAIGLIRVWDDLTFLVRASIKWAGQGNPDWTDVRAIADRIDTLLHNHEAVTSELQVHSFREESFTDETIESGSEYLHAGGIYRLRAHAL
jgi:hypothetical protein